MAKIAVTTITLPVVRLTVQVLSMLERRGLVRQLRPTAKIRHTRTTTGAVDVLARSRPNSGSHMLIGIGKRSTEIKLGYHNGSEEFILLNPTNITFKSLYLIIALDPRRLFEKKCASTTLRARDLLAVECVFNDPATCVFTLLQDTVHGEVTSAGPGQHPLFYVAEPSRLKQRNLRTPGYRFLVGEK